MKKTILTVGVLVVAIAVIVSVGLIIRSKNQAQNQTGEIVFQDLEFDFGVIRQSGGIITREFPFVYQGTEERRVVAALGSCACTTAEVDVEILKPGVQGILTVSFDPNLHEEPEGRFYKNVSIITDPVLETEAEIRIWAEIDLDLGPEFFKLSGETHDDDHGDQGYGEIHANKFDARLANKDFFLLDVHIPEQDHIKGTDAFIPFNEITDNLNQLPKDKNKEIIIYCRSGSMSQVAAETLLEQGYSNVTYLEGGKRKYDEYINK